MARSNPLAIIVIIVGIVVLAVALKGNYLQIPELPSSLGDNIYAVLPGLFVTIFGMVIIMTNFNNPIVVAGFGGIGFGLALLFAEMYAAAIIDDTILAGMTLVQLQSITVIVSIVLGGAAYASRR